MLRFSKTIIFLAFLLFIAGLIFLEVGVSFAKENPTVTFIPQVSIGEEFIAGKAVKITGTTLAKYIMAFYKWAIRAITIIAVVMLMIGGFQWMMAGGNANIVGQAKARMASALAGLVLVLGAYLLLNFVNPALTRFRSLDIRRVKRIELGPTNWCEDHPDARPVTQGKTNCGDKGIIPATAESEEEECIYKNCPYKGGWMQICARTMGRYQCMDVEKICTIDSADKEKEECKARDNYIVSLGGGSYGVCAFCGDGCCWKERFTCPYNWHRISCYTPISREGEKPPITTTPCDDKNKDPCTDEERAACGIDGICCAANPVYCGDNPRRKPEIEIKEHCESYCPSGQKCWVHPYVREFEMKQSVKVTCPWKWENTGSSDCWALTTKVCKGCRYSCE